MLFKRVLALAACAAAAVSVSASTAAKRTSTSAKDATSPSAAGGDHIQFKIRDGSIASRAVNLGGWLLAEYWMTFTSPLWKDVPVNSGWDGEYVAMKNLGKKKGDAAFEEHWSTWITEKDIAEIAKTGLNTLRVSTGFWIINDEDDSDQSAIARTYASGGLKYLDKVINEWGVKYNLAVMVSLHAHKGSQNGLDHSAPVVKGKTTWSDDPENAKSSLNYAKFIANRYKDSPAFLGLNLMNEPSQPTNYDVLKKYYTDAYNAIRADGNDCIIVTSPWLTDQGPGSMEDFMPCPAFYNVWHEFHIYYKWGWEGVSKRDVFKAAGNYSNSHFVPWKGNPVFLGEWSLATTDEVPLSPAEMTKLWELMLREAEAAPTGWAFWAWRHDEETEKTPSAWSLRQLLKLGIVEIPTDVPVRTKVDDSKCAKRVNPNAKVSKSSSSGSLEEIIEDSQSGSGLEESSSGSGSPPGSLFKPKEVTPPKEKKESTTPAPSVETPKEGAAASVAMVGASLIAVISTTMALLQ